MCIYIYIYICMYVYIHGDTHAPSANSRPANLHMSPSDNGSCALFREGNSKRTRDGK